MKAKRYKNNKKLSKKRVIMFFIFIISSAIFVVSFVTIIRYFIQSNSNQKIHEDISGFISVNEDKEDKEEDKYKIDFTELKNRNNDTIGYLRVYGTDIDHVVVQGKDNDYYLHHNFDKEKNVAGWVFADYNNKFDGTDKNIIIYGHNMRNGKMFSTLKNILTDNWQKNENNRKIVFITETDNSLYEVFSVYQIEDEDYYITTDFSDGSFKEFIDKVKNRSEYDFGVDVSQNDSILTLSTCANNNKYRVVLHAKKISK